MKKILSYMVCLLLLCLLTGAMAAGPAVIDDADLFSYDEEQQLSALVEQFREKHEMDFGIITTAGAHDRTQQDIADEYYELGEYGMGEYGSGILYYIDMYERIPYLCTSGLMIDYMTDERIEAAHENVYNYLAYGQYGDAAAAMIETVDAYMRKGIPEGQYRYDVITGQRLTSYHNALTTGEIGVCAILAAIAALIYTASVKHGYSLKGSTYDYSFRENSEVILTDRTDEYLRTTTTRTRKAQPPPPSDGGGSGHRSGGSGVHVSRSSGRSFGGGAGRKF